VYILMSNQSPLGLDTGKDTLSVICTNCYRIHRRQLGLVRRISIEKYLVIQMKDSPVLYYSKDIHGIWNMVHLTLQ